ncbi:MAG: PAS domain S-box protein [Verrucomicrobiota bacterium JB024]|nr:PAS domain S-box protein [Verrucomicrobiota bacterium JB024]
MHRYTRQSAVLGAISVVVSGVVLIGWFTDVAVVKSVGPGLATMKFNTALCFVLSALALLTIARKRWPEAGMVLAGLSLVIALATLVEYWLGLELRIDELVVVDPDTAPEDFPGRMSQATAFCFAMLDCSLLLLMTKKERLVLPAQITALVAFLGGMIGVNGYLLEVSALYNFFWFSSMAVHTSLLFVLLGAGVLLARPDRGLSSIFTSKLMGGRFSRRLMPVALLLPMALGWLLLEGAQADLYPPLMIVDLFAVIMMLILCGVILYQGVNLNLAHQKLIRQTDRLIAAEQENALYAAVVSSSDAAIVSESTDGKILTWNASAERIYGYTAEEMIGQTMARLIPHDILSDEADVIMSIRRGSSRGHFDTKRRCKDGRLVDVSVVVSSITDPSGKQIGLSRIARDISDKKKAEADMRASLREIQDLKTALDEHAIVAITDPTGKITYVNDKFCAISKYPREELIGKDHRILNSGFHPKEFMADLWNTIQQGKVFHGKIRNVAKDGSIYWVETTIVPFLGEDGKPRQYVAVRSDITENMMVADTLARQAARLARSNKDLEQFAYIASHDLQEPLRAVAGCVQLLKKRYGGKLDAKADEFIAHTVDGAERMQRLIRDLLAFSRVSTRGDTMQPVNLQQPLDTALKNLSVLISEGQASITHDTLPDVKVDAGQLAMVFQNLIGNALKFRGEKRPEIHIGARQEGREWIISVRDNGIGIEPDYFDRIFVIFQRLHTRDEYSGTGIGLALCKRIAERHGGRIWVESAPGEGSTFYFSLRDDYAEDWLD